ncbi:TPA: hypothetical protein EYN98_00370 [Candidatus Poribacteria bacterium]|nr:hypothetical protein [Candidatus Poribacteria bacterium]HIA64534.1 hypothetical protein [Candidatus Poribacteria bacterium]
MPQRRSRVKHIYHLYIIRVKRRDELLQCLQKHGVKAKIYHPISVYLHGAAIYLEYRKDDFSVCKLGRKKLTLPVNKFV